jgi:hypothetical protein
MLGPGLLAELQASPAGTDGGAEKQRGGPHALLRGFHYYSSGPRGWGGNAPPRFLDPRLAREHLRLGRAAQQHNQALKRFKRIGNRSAGGTADGRAVYVSRSAAPRSLAAKYGIVLRYTM